MEDYIIAIDLGTYQTRIVAAQYDEKKLFKLNVIYKETQNSKGIRRGVIYDTENCAKVVNNLIMGAEKRLGDIKTSGEAAKAKRKKTYYLCVGLAGLAYTTSTIKASVDVGERVSNNTIEELEGKVKSIIDQNTKDEEALIHMSTISYSIDNEPETLDVEGKRANSIMGKYLYQTIRRTYATDINNVFANASSTTNRVKPHKSMPTAEAKGNILLLPSMKNEGVALVDIGEGCVDVAVYYGGTLRNVVSIPLGSYTITKDIATALDIEDENTARLWKEKIGIVDKEVLDKTFELEMKNGNTKSISAAEFSFVVKARTEELIAYVDSAIQEHKRHIQTIVLTGAGSRLNNICDMFVERTGINTILSESHLTEIDDATLQNYAGSLGLAQTMAFERHEDLMGKQTVVDNAKETAKQQNEQSVVSEAQKPIEEQETSNTNYATSTDTTAQPKQETESIENRPKGFWGKVFGGIKKNFDDVLLNDYSTD